MRKPIIELTRVSKVYPPDIVALDDFSLAIGRGEIVFLTGMSGAGKSTLLKLICGIERPTRGMVEVAGFDLARITPANLQLLRQKVGVAYQDFRLLPNLSVFENVAMAMEVTYKNASLIARRVDDLLNMLVLSDKRDQPTAKLSRGEQQRVAIARAAANSPPVLLADEPTGNLDAAISAQVMLLFRQLNDAGSTIIIATHDDTIYRNSPHRRVELRQGRLFEEKCAGDPPLPGEQSRSAGQPIGSLS
ncbi:MAG: cell division ATP-binding protein FtsE [Thermodesulfobacteriota bacterium]